MKIPILSGIYVDSAPDFRTALPRNYVPVPKETGINEGYLKPAEGIASFATGQGGDRGGVNWNGICYRVSGSKLVQVGIDGTVTVLGDVDTDDTPVSMDYSFDRLAIASARKLFYWDGSALTQVTDPNLGKVLHVLWIAGYFATTDGTNVVVTNLQDPTTVNPLKYGSSEADPDPVKCNLKLRNELYTVNRYTVEVMDNVGGNFFPFQPVEGALFHRGAIGAHAAIIFTERLTFLGSARNEPPGVWIGAGGETRKISTREVDRILQDYTEDQLSRCVVEAKVHKEHQHLLVHLPDRTLVYDAAATAVLKEPVWFTLDSGLLSPAQYRGRGLVWCHDRWIVGDPTGSGIGVLTDEVSTHYADTIGWDFGTVALYNEGRGAVVHNVELVCLPGRVPLGADPTVWTSYTLDGETPSMEKPISAGKQGERQKRLAWRRQGHFRNWRIQHFRGTSDAHLPVARLEMELEALNG